MTKSLLFSCFECPTRPGGHLTDIPEDLLDEFGNARITNVYKKGQTLFYEGNRPYGIYCISSGKIKLYKTNSEGKEYIVHIAKPGDIIGYRAFFTDGSYPHSAEVLEDAVVCFLDKEKFFNLLKDHPPFSLRLLEIMSHELNCAEDKTTGMAYDSTHERIVELILTLKETYGLEQENGEYKLDIQLSRDDLAGMMGTTTETVVRLMSWLKEKDLVVMSKKNIIIRDIAKLSALLPEY